MGGSGACHGRAEQHDRLTQQTRDDRLMVLIAEGEQRDVAQLRA